MGYLPEMYEEIMRDRKKAFRFRKIVLNGNERTLEEVISNNIIEYMNSKNLSSEEKITYLNMYKLYLNEECEKSKGTNFMCNGLSTAGVISVIYCFGTYRDNLAYTACFLTAFVMIINAIVNKCRPNIYEEPFKTQYENTFFESLIEEDESLRKAIKYNKDAKKLLK